LEFSVKKGFFMFRKILLTALVLQHSVACADFLTALQAYEKKDYATAQFEFSALLPLANEQAAFNLAAMAFNGEGQAVDKIKALAYFEFAASFGHQQAPEQALRIKQSLTTADVTKASELLAQLTKSVVIHDSQPEIEKSELEAIKRVAPEYPSTAASRGLFGYVTIRYVVNEKGNVIAVDALDSFPEHVFERSAMNAVKKWQYKPTGKKQLGTVKMTYSMGTLDKRSMERWLDQYQVWPYAVAGSPQHQEALGSFLHLMHNNAGINLEVDENASFDPKKLPSELFAKRTYHRPQEIEHFSGFAQVTVNKDGIVTKILQAKDQKSHSADEILLNKPLANIRKAGTYNLVSQTDNKVSIIPVVRVNPLYRYQYWWTTAAKNGDLRAQRFLASMDKQWENYLLDKNDPQTQTWAAARMLLEGDTELGKALLAKAQQQNYPLAQELKDSL
jgi:TonB family protein